jgi:hypothetical protein
VVEHWLAGGATAALAGGGAQASLQASFNGKGHFQTVGVQGKWQQRWEEEQWQKGLWQLQSEMSQSCSQGYTPITGPKTDPTEIHFKTKEV